MSLPALPCRTSVPAAHRTCYPLNFRGVVGKRITASRQIAGALQHQGFHVRRQRKVSRREHGVGAFARILGHHVPAMVDEVRVVAGAAAHDVGAAAAVEEIVAAVAGDDIDQVVAVALQIGATLQGQVLHIHRQRKMETHENRVGTLVRILDHRIAAIVDDIGVIAQAADHGVGAARAVENVVAIGTTEGVGIGGPGDVHVGNIGRRERQAVAAQHFADGCCRVSGPDRRPVAQVRKSKSGLSIAPYCVPSRENRAVF